MFRKFLRALWAALFHGVVLMAAHALATHSGEAMREVAGLVRDEWVVTGIDAILASR